MLRMTRLPVFLLWSCRKIGDEKWGNSIPGPEMLNTRARERVNFFSMLLATRATNEWTVFSLSRRGQNFGCNIIEPGRDCIYPLECARCFSGSRVGEGVVTT